MGLPTRMRPIRSGWPWHYREGAWPGFERTLTVSNWARGYAIPTTTLAPYRTEIQVWITVKGENPGLRRERQRMARGIRNGAHRIAFFLFFKRKEAKEKGMEWLSLLLESEGGSTYYLLWGDYYVDQLYLIFLVLINYSLCSISDFLNGTRFLIPGIRPAIRSLRDTLS